MKESSPHVLRWTLLIILVILMLNGISDENTNTQGSLIVSPSFIISNGYTPHEPFNITGDTELSSLGLDGSGIESDPYVIEGYNFTDYEEESAIILKDTTKHVEIRGCYFGGTGKVAIVIGAAHNVTLVAYDEIGNSISDSVTVTIHPQSGILGIDPMITNVLSLAAIVLILMIGYRIVKSSKEKKKEKDWKDMLDDFTQS